MIEGASFLITGGTVVLPGALAEPGFVAIRDGTISSVGAGDRPPDGVLGREAREVSADGLVVGPGFVDVHVHGGAGCQVNGDSPDEVVAALTEIARFHARHGTAALLATTVSDSFDRLAATVAGVALVMAEGVENGARVLGAHLEGPWIARAKMGAQDPTSLRLPDPDELRTLCDAAPGTVRLVTLAPELPGATELAEVARACGAAVAIGHTDATYEVARQAIDAGARHATHLFNAMTPLHHRRPGSVVAALLDDRVTLELVADGEHLHPAIVELVARFAPDRIVLVSDAVPASGLESGRYELGRLEVEVTGRRVTLALDPATLAGSLLTMDRAVANLVAARVRLPTAFAAATSTPARVAGHGDTGYGMLRPGAPADLVLLHADGSAVATVIGGRPVHDPGGLFGGVA